MKVLIWIASFLMVVTINVIIAAVTGFMLGYGLTPLLVWLIARALCRRYDKAKAKRKIGKVSIIAEREGLTWKEYLLKNAPSSFIGACEHHRGDKRKLKEFLKYSKEQGNISKEGYTVFYLLYRYKQ